MNSWLCLLQDLQSNSRTQASMTSSSILFLLSKYYIPDCSISNVQLFLSGIFLVTHWWLVGCPAGVLGGGDAKIISLNRFKKPLLFSFSNWKENYKLSIMFQEERQVIAWWRVGDGHFSWFQREPRKAQIFPTSPAGKPGKKLIAVKWGGSVRAGQWPCLGVKQSWKLKVEKHMFLLWAKVQGCQQSLPSWNWPVFFSSKVVMFSYEFCIKCGGTGNLWVGIWIFFELSKGVCQSKFGMRVGGQGIKWAMVLGGQTPPPLRTQPPEPKIFFLCFPRWEYEKFSCFFDQFFKKKVCENTIFGPF